MNALQGIAHIKDLRVHLGADALITIVCRSRHYVRLFRAALKGDPNVDVELDASLPFAFVCSPTPVRQSDEPGRMDVTIRQTEGPINLPQIRP